MLIRLWCVTLRVVTRSRANYIASYAMDLACPIVFGIIGLRQGISVFGAIFSACAGWTAFSLIEYAIHRWLFHAPGSVMGAMHQAHHDDPHDHVALPFITSAVFGAVSWLMLSAVVGSAVTCCFLCGLLSGYFYYAALHHLEHSVRISAVPMRWLQRRWAIHSVHHRLVDKNFGVTTTVGDRVFGTHYQSGRVR